MRLWAVQYGQHLSATNKLLFCKRFELVWYGSDVTANGTIVRGHCQAIAKGRTTASQNQRDALQQSKMVQHIMLILVEAGRYRIDDTGS
jgi:hypothetical protein